MKGKEQDGYVLRLREISIEPTVQSGENAQSDLVIYQEYRGEWSITLLAINCNASDIGIPTANYC